MQGTIVSIGNELLIGKTINTNLSIIAKTLYAMGIEVNQALCVKDDLKSIHQTLSRIDDDFIIITGGLGPTPDDLTKEAVCAFYGLELTLHQQSLTRIEEAFKSMHKPMDKSNLKQAYFPSSAIVLNNDNGTAPGAIFQVGKQTIVLLPGPPTELMPMLEPVKAYLLDHLDYEVFHGGYLVVGVGESEMEHRLDGFYDAHQNVIIAPYAGLGEIQYIFTSKDATALKTALKAFYKRFKDVIVGPYDTPLEHIVVQTLQAQNKTISFAESCTGGLLAGRLINVPGASRVFNESYVLYSDAAKIKQLGVHQSIIDQFGAVSNQCVYELSYQLAQRTSSDISVSVSGIAGPEGGTDDKPVGTVYFGITHEGRTKTVHHIFAGDRQMIRQKAVAFALNLVIKTLTLAHEDIH